MLRIDACPDVSNVDEFVRRDRETVVYMAEGPGLVCTASYEYWWRREFSLGRYRPPRLFVGASSGSLRIASCMDYMTADGDDERQQSLNRYDDMLNVFCSATLESPYALREQVSAMVRKLVDAVCPEHVAARIVGSNRCGAAMVVLTSKFSSCSDVRNHTLPFTAWVVGAPGTSCEDTIMTDDVRHVESAFQLREILRASCTLPLLSSDIDWHCMDGIFSMRPSSLFRGVLRDALFVHCKGTAMPKLLWDSASDVLQETERVLQKGLGNALLYSLSAGQPSPVVAHYVMKRDCDRIEWLERIVRAQRESFRERSDLALRNELRIESVCLAINPCPFFARDASLQLARRSHLFVQICVWMAAFSAFVCVCMVLRRLLLKKQTAGAGT